MSAQIQVGLVGLGWGEQVAHAARDLPCLRIASCYSRGADARREFAVRFGCRACGDYQELLSDSALDGVIIITPNATHRDLVIQALNAGKHVLVTKPIAPTLWEAAEMIETSRRAGRILAVGHQSRRQLWMRKLKDLVTQGMLGEPLMIEGNTSSPTGLTLSERSWRSSAETCPGGPLLQLGIHYVDNFQYLVGPIETVASWQHHAGMAPVGASTTLSAFVFTSGATGSLLSSYVVPSTRWMRVTGREAVASYDMATGLVMQASGAYPKIILAPAPGDLVTRAAIAEELVEFAECIRQQRRPEIDGTQGMRNLAVVLAAVESQRSGGHVRISDLLRGDYQVR